MDTTVTAPLHPAFHIRTKNGMSLVGPDLMRLMQDIVKQCGELGKALAAENFSNQKVCAEPCFRTTGGEALLMLEPYQGAQGVLKHVELEIKGYVLALNKISEQINLNALLRFRKPLEDVVGKKNTIKVLKAMSSLKSAGCIITGQTQDGELEAYPPPIEAFATPAQPEEKSLVNAPVTGVELLPEGGCLVTAAHELRIAFTDVSDDRARTWLAEPTHFSGHVSKKAGSWIIDTSTPYSFDSAAALKAGHADGASSDLPLPKTGVPLANSDSHAKPPKSPKGHR